ncbi:Membrane-bound lytic murein transglycosylase B [hydrothermal vent metagenome]|uniref:Membrane-bound lytic murein transglycosylase B n=1 Tax=hydrothermal vent metagenome TaxID=652676 RepID=A0A3B0YRC4_9ZZZZ
MISKIMRCCLLFLALATTTHYVLADSRDDYSAWLVEFKKEAISKGISEKTLERAFKGVKPQPRVVTLDRSQPETVQTLQDYINKRVTAFGIELGRKKFRENHALLQKIESRFGVQGRFIVAFWGLETSYGRYTGGHNVIAAITTLAFDKRRGSFFRKQLLDALFIIETGHIRVDQMTGSWAGAMGQTQFMPSTFRAYAIDGDGDGKIDIWGSKADAFSSAANYLSKIGWKDDQTWGREVQLPVKFNQRLIKKKIKKTLPEWQALGVRRINGNNLPQRKLEANIILPDGPGGRAFITYPANYNAILNWNRSHKFAISIGTLADAIAQ